MKNKKLKKREEILMQLQLDYDFFFSDEKTKELLNMGHNAFYKYIEKFKQRKKK